VHNGARLDSINLIRAAAAVQRSVAFAVGAALDRIALRADTGVTVFGELIDDSGRRAGNFAQCPWDAIDRHRTKSREELKDMARRLGTVGYYVLLPNLYYLLLVLPTA
jgi:hypothetical protein